MYIYVNKVKYHADFMNLHLYRDAPSWRSRFPFSFSKYRLIIQYAYNIIEWYLSMILILIDLWYWYLSMILNDIFNICRPIMLINRFWIVNWRTCGSAMCWMLSLSRGADSNFWIAGRTFPRSAIYAKDRHVWNKLMPIKVIIIWRIAMQMMLSSFFCFIDKLRVV